MRVRAGLACTMPAGASPLSGIVIVRPVDSTRTSVASDGSAGDAVTLRPHSGAAAADSSSVTRTQPDSA